MEAETSRRGFFTKVAKIPVGVSSVRYLLPLAIGSSLAAESIPGHKSGNAGYEEGIKQDCEAEHPANKALCQNPNTEFDPSSADMIATVIVAPPIEEGLFRALPSKVMDLTVGEHREDSAQTLGLSRREWLAGGITSLLFGAAHNFTSKGFDTKTIPAAQITFGLGFWRLQRREGYVANTSAHMTVNGLLLGLTKVVAHFRK